MGKIAFLFTVFIFASTSLFARSSKNADAVAHCSLGKIASKETDNQLRKSECLQYCINAFAATEAQYEQDGTVSKSVCQWGSRDLLVLGGFTNENSPELVQEVAKSNSPNPSEAQPKTSAAADAKSDNRPPIQDLAKQMLTSSKSRVPASATPPPPPPPPVQQQSGKNGKGSGGGKGKSGGEAKKSSPPSPPKVIVESSVSEPPRTIVEPTGEPPRF